MRELQREYQFDVTSAVYAERPIPQMHVNA